MQNMLQKGMKITLDVTLLVVLLLYNPLLWLRKLLWCGYENCKVTVPWYCYRLHVLHFLLERISR